METNEEIHITFAYSEYLMSKLLNKSIAKKDEERKQRYAEANSKRKKTNFAELNEKLNKIWKDSPN
jgi:hypothetical protein